MQLLEPVNSNKSFLRPCSPLMDNLNDGMVARVLAMNTMFISQMFTKVSLSAFLAEAELDLA